MKGTELFVKALQKEGIDYLFAYPGGYAIDIFDELYKQDSIQVILPRHEQGLVHAADGYARATGRTGVCLVTSGPGATNLVTGIATANYDSVPLVCFTGQVPTHLIGNDAFQEVDIVGITRSICKYAVTVRKREDLGRVIKEAFYIANTGKKGPVVVDLPKDVMLEEGDDLYPKEVNIRGYKPSKGVHMGQLKKAIGLLKEAKRPLFLMGGGVNIGRANQEALALVEATGIPVITTIMGKGALPTNHPLYMGNVGMHGCYAANRAISECDVLFSIGTRFNDRITGKIEEFAKNAKIVHIDIDTASISRNIQVDIPVVADAKEAMGAMLKHVKNWENKEWLEQIRGWKKEHPLAMQSDKGITPEKIIKCINQQFEEAIVVTDVGQHQMWVTQYLEMDEKKKLLTSGGLGTMGYGLPAALGAQFAYPDTPVICVAGDGGIQMNIQEMATATAYGLPVIICIFNNSYLGMVRQWQQLFYGKRYSSTCTRRRKSCSAVCKGPGPQCPEYEPDFVKLAESYEAYGMRIEKEEEIENAFRFAMEHRDAPTILEFIIDSEELVLPMVQGGQALDHMILEC
ncbi:MAG: biosynthetic-type acetolactate synthase large subunit [Blautia sp.]